MPDQKDNPDPAEGLVDRALKELVAEGAAAVTRHPDVEALVAFQEGRLDADRTEKVQRHLVVCPQCAQDVLDLASFDVDHDPALEPSKARSRDTWDLIQSQEGGSKSGGETETAKPVASTDGTFELTDTPRESARNSSGYWEEMQVPPATIAPNPSWLRSLYAPRGLTALAASTLFLGVALGYILFSVSGSGGTATPRTAQHPFLFDPPPATDSQRRAPESIGHFKIPPETDLLIARLNLADQTPYADGYRVVGTDKNEIVIFSQSDVRRHPEGYFLVELPSEDFPGGEYSLSLTGLQAGAETDLDTYRFLLSSSSSP